MLGEWLMPVILAPQKAEIWDCSSRLARAKSSWDPHLTQQKLHMVTHAHRPSYAESVNRGILVQKVPWKKTGDIESLPSK
jgi:hypothetical protein